MSVYAVNLLRELVDNGHDVTMISQYRGDEVGTRVYGGGPPPAVTGVKVIGLEALGEQNGGNFETDIATMLQVSLAEHLLKPFDIFHAQYGYPTGLVALEASKRTGVPCVVSIQGGDGHWVGSCCATHKAAMAAVLNHADALLIGSISFAKEVEQNHGTSLQRFTIVPGAVDVNRFFPGESHNPPRFLYHGRVDARKGVLDLLEAWKQTAKKTALIISGIGPDSTAVSHYIERLQLGDSVTQTGYVAYDAVPMVYRSSDIFVSPTYAEGFSNTILEAMASGLPIISTRAVGVVDCIQHDRNGLLVDPGDKFSLASAMTDLVGNSNLRTRLSASALQDVHALYSWKTVAKLIINIYEKLEGRRHSGDWHLDCAVAPCRFRSSPHLL